MSSTGCCCSAEFDGEVDALVYQIDKSIIEEMFTEIGPFATNRFTIGSRCNRRKIPEAETKPAAGVCEWPDSTSPPRRVGEDADAAFKKIRVPPRSARRSVCSLQQADAEPVFETQDDFCPPTDLDRPMRSAAEVKLFASATETRCGNARFPIVIAVTRSALQPHEDSVAIGGRGPPVMGKVEPHSPRPHPGISVSSGEASSEGHGTSKKHSGDACAEPFAAKGPDPGGVTDS